MIAEVMESLKHLSRRVILCRSPVWRWMSGPRTPAVAEVLPRRQWLVIGYQERTEREKTDSREPWRGIGKTLCRDRPGVERMTVEDRFCSSDGDRRAALPPSWSVLGSPPTAGCTLLHQPASRKCPQAYSTYRVSV